MDLSIADALNKLRNLKSKIARTERYINESVTFYADENPQYVYATEMAARSALVKEIRDLKTKIQLANSTTKVEYKGAECTLAELILINADLRAELAYQQRLLDHELHVTSYRHVARTKDEISKVFAEGYDKSQIREGIDSLEKEKEEVESVINSTNLRTKLN